MSKPARPSQGKPTGHAQGSWWPRLSLSGAMSVILLLGGCATDSTLRPMTVSVRDGLTHRPVPGALVRVTSVHFHFPWPPFQKFDPIAHLASQAVTDENGVARLGAYVNHPMQVIVTREGSAPYRLYLERHPFRQGEEKRWFRDDLAFADVGGTSHDSLEVQLRP